MHDLRSTQQYYDRFATTYERERHRGYHRLIDDLELELVRRYGTGLDVLEAGCGTGLLLAETARVARSAHRARPVGQHAGAGPASRPALWCRAR